jgi:hypothetical protein
MSAPQQWTTMELVRWTADFFKQHEVPQARLDDEILLAHVLGGTRMDLYLAFDKPSPRRSAGATASWSGAAPRSAYPWPISRSGASSGRCRFASLPPC